MLNGASVKLKTALYVCWIPVPTGSLGYIIQNIHSVHSSSSRRVGLWLLKRLWILWLVETFTNLFSLKDIVDPVTFHHHLIRLPVITSSKWKGNETWGCYLGTKQYIFICGFNIRSCSAFLERIILVRSKCTLQVYQPFGDCRLPAATLK